MKTKSLRLRNIVLVLFACYPAISFAAAPTSGAYVTDVTDQYVEDEASKVLAGANSVLCYMGAMGPELMVNQGAYVALIDSKKCDSNSGGDRGNHGASFQKAFVDSSQITGSPLVAKVWVNTPYANITAKASSTKAPSATLPYGEYTMNWCGTATAGTAGSCSEEKGYITAASSGLSYFSTGQRPDMSGAITTETNSLTLNASTVADSGTGALSQAKSGGTTSSLAISFAYNASYFLRSEDSGVTLNCFDRALANADKSAWGYGLYDATGAQVDRKSGFPIEYTASGATVNGYVGYWGFWSESGTSPASGTTVLKVDYSTGAPVRTAYTLFQSGGKLLKHTTASKTLAAVDKQRFWFGSGRNLKVAGVPLLSPAQYELYWDNTAGQFYVSGTQNATSGNMESLPTPVAISNADMVTATSFSYQYPDPASTTNPPAMLTVSTSNGLNAWTQSGQWNIDGTAMAALATTGSTTTLLVDSEDIVYPDAAVGTLKCIVDCPQATAATATPAFLNDSATTTSVTTANVKSYTLDATTGNLMNGVTAVTNLTSNGSFSQAFGTQGSGKLVDAAGWTAITTKNTTGTYSAADLGPVTTFYTWQSSTNQWEQLSGLKDSTTGILVKFDAPLTVDFVVPANTDTVNKKPYGNSAGTTISLDYGGFGDLWGISTSCVDLTTNSPCDFTLLSASQSNFSFKPDFSIPAGSTVSYTPAGGTLTTLYVKPLSEEVRFKKVASSVCTTAGVTLPATTSGLPQASGWTDPALGAAPTVTNTAPRVIQGVVKY